MTTTPAETSESLKAPKSLDDLWGGQMSCDIAGCKAIFNLPVDLDGVDPTPVRQRLQRVASSPKHGWKQTTAGLFVCPGCASGPLGWVVARTPRWNVRLGVEPRLPVMHGDNVSTMALPAIRVADLRTSPAGPHPYDPSKGSAA